MSFKILSVVGARPNFRKIAAICDAINEFNQRAPGERINHILVHTGQHYDANMSDSFFNDLELPRPTITDGSKGTVVQALRRKTASHDL